MSTPLPNPRRRSFTLTSEPDRTESEAADVSTANLSNTRTTLPGRRPQQRTLHHRGFGLNPIESGIKGDPGQSSKNTGEDERKGYTPCTSNLSINIHSADGFGGALTVTDISKIPWGRAGDIVEVRPARALPDGGTRARKAATGEGEGGGRQLNTVTQKKERVKGNFLFKLRGNDEQQLRRLTTAISVSEQVAQVFPLPNRSEVVLTRMELSDVEADFIELYFTGQYLGRADMWRLGMSLEDKCVFVRQKVEFAGIKAEVKNIYIKGKRRASGYVSSTTKTIYRSKSAQSYLFLQLCKEMFDFDEDGERYYEKALYGFLPELFQRWKDAQANHVVTIILFARVFYNAAEIAHLANLKPHGKFLTALQHDAYLGHYKDFYKVIVDFETRQEWHSIMPVLKQQMLETHEEILLIYHTDADEAAEVKIIGRLGYAFEGNVLECMNLVLNPFDESYIDRDLSRTGLSIVVITPGVGHFAVNKNMLRLTTERLLDLGITLDLVCLAQLPLHVTPIFSFMSPRLPESKEAGPFRASNFGRLQDVLYYDAPSDEDRPEEEHYSLAPWVYCSFYSRSYDKPFRSDRFVPRCKMHEIQMLGVIDHDLSTLSLPMLEPELPGRDGESADLGTTTPRCRDGAAEARTRRLAHEFFDQSIFSGGDIGHPRSSDPQGLLSSGMITPALSSDNAETHEKGNRGAWTAGSTTPRPSQQHLGLRSEALASPDPLKTDLEASLEAATAGSRPSSTTTLRRSAIAQRESESKRGADHSLEPEGDTQRLAETTPRTAPTSAAADLMAFDKQSRSLSSKLSRSTLSSLAGIFRGLNPRPNPTPPVTALHSVAAISSPPLHNRTAASKLLETSSLNTRSSLSTEPRVTDRPIPPTLYQVRQTPVRPVASMEVKPVSAQKRIEAIASTKTDSDLLGTSQVEPLAIPTKGKSTDRRVSRRRHTGQELASSVGRSQRPPSANHKRGNPILDVERPAVETGQVAFSLPSQRGGSSFPYGNSYKRSYMSSINPCRPRTRSIEKASKARRWQHALPRPTFTQDVKWDSLCAPACLPLTSDMVPKDEELKSQYHEQLYHFDCQANQLSFLLRPPGSGKQWDLPIEVLREMASQRLSQNFQFIVSGGKAARGAVLSRGDVEGIRSGGASDILKAAEGPLYLSTPNQVHRLNFATDNRNQIDVHIHTRMLDYTTASMDYVCLVWPRKRKAYELGTATFRYPTRNYDFNYLDRLISGAEDQFTDSLRYWRTRFILIPSDRPPVSSQGPIGEIFSEQEVYINGATRLLELISKHRWKGGNEDLNSGPLKLLPTWLAPSACVTDTLLMQDLQALQSGSPSQSKCIETQGEIGQSTLSDIANAMRDPKNGLRISDRWWQKTFHPDTFQGDDFVTWLLDAYGGIKSRESATDWGRKLMDQGLIEHCDDSHGFLDGYYYYRLTERYSASGSEKKQTGWFSRSRLYRAAPDRKSGSTTTGNRESFPTDSNATSANQTRPKRKRKVQMSQTTILDLDPQRRSDRAEVAILHSDIIHNPNNAFHFELNWIGVTAGLLDDMRQRWSVLAEKHGLRLVEAPVEQIKDIGKKCAYRPCFAIQLALAPPTISDLDERLPEQYRTANYFEYAILTKKFGFVLDVEATYRYPDDLEVEYSYRKAAVFEHSQFVHKSGLALVQCVGGIQGFLWSDNRLFFSASSRFRGESYQAASSLSKQQQADQLREELEAFCANADALANFYATVLPPVQSDDVQLDEKQALAEVAAGLTKETPSDDDPDDVGFTGPYGL